jgi:hypothetical protein
LDAKGFDYEFIKPRKHFLGSKINWLSLWLFDYYTSFTTRKLLAGYDIVFLQDLRFLHIAKYAKKLGKNVVYETIDNNVHLRLHDLKKKIPLIKPFLGILSQHFVAKEKSLAFNYCDKIAVNSKALQDYFDGKCELIHYSSPLELFHINNDPEKTPALLYLGAFTEDKGAFEILDLQNNLTVDLYIIGTVFSNEIKKRIKQSPQIKHYQRVGQAKLGEIVKSLVHNYFLIGISLIKPVNYSYATQEANKDIDYLALGIPIIGNYREPTKEKILAGCGVFIDDKQGINLILYDTNYRKALTTRCKDYYANNYSNQYFELKMANIFRTND